jgi:hypothetical protein
MEIKISFFVNGSRKRARKEKKHKQGLDDSINLLVVCRSRGEKGRNADGVKTNADGEDMETHRGGTGICFDTISRS